MQWKKDPSKKYTDLCIYIDENIPKIINPGEFPEIENKVYNYLWLLVKALAIKKCMFQNFEDYDLYSFYAANRLFFALRKNQLNQGKIIKGKEIRPIKSCLNYTKALLYPMKIEYQRETYREVIDEEFVSKKFDALNFREQLKTNIRATAQESKAFVDCVAESFEHITELIDKVLERSPFNKTSVEYKKLRISLMLNYINNLKTKNKLAVDPTTVTLWKLPKSMSSYVKVLFKELSTELKKEIIDCYKSVAMDDATVESILTYREGQDYDYDEQD